MDSDKPVSMPCCKAQLSVEEMVIRSLIIHCDKYPGLCVVRTACPNLHCSTQFTYRFNRVERVDGEERYVDIVSSFRKLGSLQVRANEATQVIRDRYLEQFGTEPLSGHLIGSSAERALQDFHREMNHFGFAWQIEAVWDDEPLDLVKEVIVMQTEARRRYAGLNHLQQTA